jgi:hypothetical protein
MPNPEMSFSSYHRKIPYLRSTGGTVTWALILEGRKIWYFPKCVTTRTVRWLAQAGSQVPEDYDDDWVKVVLWPGDLM